MTPTAINVQKLSKVPFFSSLSQEQLEQVANEAQEFAFSKNETVRNETDKTNAFWILLYGSWRMERFIEGTKPIVLETENIGTWHSGIELLDRIAPVKVTATSHSYIMRVPIELMYQWIEQGFPIRAHLLKGVQSGAKRIFEHIQK